VTDRANKLVGIADALGLALPTSLTSMSDEEWAAHDARVAAERATHETTAAPRNLALIANGFPRRALEEAAHADASKSAIRRVSAWLTRPEGVLVISGGEGCGKTVASAWWATRLAQVATFVRAASFARSSRYEQDRSALVSAPALVLDDLGAEYLDGKGSFLVDLDELIDVFYGDRKPLLITTNCTDGDFKERYGARIAGRIRERGAFFGIADGSLRSPTKNTTTKRRTT
jgi:DNA replication protein DnaC